MEYMAALRMIQIEMGDRTTDDQTVIRKMTDADRHRFMSDPEIKYAVVDDVIHDKQCEKLRGVSNDFIKFISSYHDHYKICSICAVRACIRAGAEDFENFEKYVEFYNSHGIFGKAIRKMYINNKCTTKLDTGVLTIRNREDTWKIVDLGKTNQVKLLHNSYTINSKCERIFNGNFHVQSERIYFSDALNKIYTYDSRVNPREHIENEAKKLEKKNRKKYKKLSLIEKLKAKRRKHLIKKYSLDGEIHLSGFRTITEFGYPKENQICAYLWETESGDRYWLIGSYSPKYRLFHAEFYGSRKNVKQENVIAWKPLCDEGFRI